MLFRLNKQTMILITTCICLLALFVALCPIDIAFAEDRYMTEIDFRKLVENPDAGSQSAILSGGISVLQQLLTFILLPLAIIFVSWKTIVVGLCTVAGIDYSIFLDIEDARSVEEEKRSKTGRRTTNGSRQTDKQNSISVHNPSDSVMVVKRLGMNTIKGLIVVFCVWGIMELIMSTVYLFIGTGEAILG